MGDYRHRPDLRIVGGDKTPMNTKYDITTKADRTLAQKELLPLFE